MILSGKTALVTGGARGIGAAICKKLASMGADIAIAALACDAQSDALEKELGKSDVIIADPLFEPICRGKKFVRVPHMAFSGRCFLKEEKQLINKGINL